MCPDYCTLPVLLSFCTSVYVKFPLYSKIKIRNKESTG